MVVDVIRKMMAPLQRRVRLMVGRGVVELIRDDTNLQTVQMTLLSEETKDQLQRFQQYGLTSVPFSQAEGVVLFVGGNRSNGIVINVDDRRYRLAGLTEGEVALYDDQGNKVHLQRNGLISIEAADKVQVTAASEVSIDGGVGSPAGVVQGQCTCAFTGAPHPQTSVTVKASL